MAPDTNNLHDMLAEVTEDVLAHLGVSAAVDVAETEAGLRGNIDSADSAILIGWHGTSLASLEYLVRLIMIRRLGDDPSKLPEVHLDVGGYKQRQVDELMVLARRSAEHVKESGHPEVLRPMNAYERRIVHVALADETEIVTESIGADPNRRIVIKPKQN